MKRSILVLTLIVVLVVGLMPMYRVYEHSGQNLVCNPEECLLIVSKTDYGWRGRNIRYLEFFFTSFLRVPTPPDNKRTRSTMFVITASGVREVELPRRHFTSLRIYDDRVYSADAEPEVWNGASFVAISPAERKEVLRATGAQGKNRMEWTQRAVQLGSANSRELAIHIGGRTMELTIEREGEHTEIVQLRSDSGQPRELFRTKQESRQVGSEQYERIFGSAGK
jgi:hypothetical protein